MVVATVEQVFPSDIPVAAVIPVHVVALGHENADAYVRRVVWKGDEPQFVGEVLRLIGLRANDDQRTVGDRGQPAKVVNHFLVARDE